MKKTFLLLLIFVTGLISFGQTPGPHNNNVDMGLFNNGSNGSNAASGAHVEVALKIKTGGLTYTAVPAAEDWIIYLRAPKVDFATDDIVSIVQVNGALYGTTSITAMTPQGGVVDIGGDPTYYYIPIVLNVAGLNLSSLSIGSPTFAFTFKIQTSGAVDRSQAAHNNIVIVDATNNAALDFAITGGPGGVAGTRTHLDMSGVTNNQLTDASFSVLPVSLLNFSGYKSGNKNVLRWTTAGEQNNHGFEVQRSSDGVTYSAIGFVNSVAPAGNSSSQLSYTFDDNNPISRKQYYRLKQTDIDGHSKLSNIVLISGDKLTSLSISALFPNPANTLVNVIVDAPKRDKLTLVVSDINGKMVKQQSVNVDIGSNTVPVEISNLAKGSYLVKLVCQSSDCETAVGKFNKQ